jgi:hypothetical protein
MNEYEKLYEEDDSNVRTISKPVGLLYSFVSFGSATLILILFEDLIKVNIYFVYIVVGLIMSFSFILMLHMLLKKI